MSEKFKVSKEVGKALDKWFNIKGHTHEYLLENQYIALHGDRMWSGDYYPLNKLTLTEVAEITTLGYEVKETKEEKLACLFDSVTNGVIHAYADYEVCGYVRKALEIVDINVPENYWKDLL